MLISTIGKLAFRRVLEFLGRGLGEPSLHKEGSPNFTALNANWYQKTRLNERRTGMPLKNFGSILNFAAELEAADSDFYKAAAANPASAQHRAVLEELASEKKKNEKLMLRACRESVCEMILEPIVDFTREPFLSGREGTQTMSWKQLRQKALDLEGKALEFYTEAAEKIQALPEVSRALTRTATRRAADKQRLEQLPQE